MSTPAIPQFLPDSLPLATTLGSAAEAKILPLAPEMVFDEGSFEVRLRGHSVPLQPQVLELIGFLARNEGRLVTKAELIRGPWRGTCVTESALHRAIMLARRALEQAGHGSPIATIRGRGFRFKAIGSSFPAQPPAASSRLDQRSLVGSRLMGEGGGSEVWELRAVAPYQRLGVLSIVRQGLSAHVTCTVRRGVNRADLTAFIDVVAPTWQVGSRRVVVIAEHDEPPAQVDSAGPPVGGRGDLSGPR